MEIPRSIVDKCRQGDESAQHSLYQYYASTMYGVCLRYFPDSCMAQDIMQEGFVKVFESIKSFRFEGSLEGWIRRIMVNTALEFHRKSNSEKEVAIDEAVLLQNDEDEISLDYQQLLALVAELPTQYRMVFNLYAIEGYSHAEIGDLLAISESTSKSNYSRAKGILREKLNRIRKYDRYAFL